MVSFCFLSLVKQSGAKTLNKQLLTVPIKLEKLHVLRKQLSSPTDDVMLIVVIQREIPNFKEATILVQCSLDVYTALPSNMGMTFQRC